MNFLIRKCAVGFAALAFALLPTTSSWAIGTISFGNVVHSSNSFSVDITASGFTDLFAYQLDVVFDPGVVSAVAVSEGSFLQTGGSTFFDGGAINNGTGTISAIFDTLVGPGAGVTGSGVLATLRFDVLQPGVPRAFSFASVTALDSQLTDLVPLTPSALLPVPEPSMLALMIAGLIGVATVARHSRSIAEPAVSRATTLRSVLRTETSNHPTNQWHTRKDQT